MQHATLCIPGGASLFDPVRHQVVVMNQVFSSHRKEVAWSSKAMLQVIQAKVEKRELFDRLFGAGAEAAGCTASAATSPHLAATSPHLAAATSPLFSCSPPPRSSSPARCQSRRDLGAAFPPGACGSCRLPMTVAATPAVFATPATAAAPAARAAPAAAPAAGATASCPVAVVHDCTTPPPQQQHQPPQPPQQQQQWQVHEVQSQPRQYSY